MTRPNQKTPVEIIVMVLRSAGTWTQKHQALLEHVFGPDYSGGEQAADLADALERAETDYVKEQREDVAMSNEREAIVERIRRVVSSARALAELAFSDHADPSEILSRFSDTPPSLIRSPRSAQDAMAQLQAAMELHADAMADRLANVESLETEIEDAARALDDVVATSALEAMSTKKAKRHRNILRKKSVELVRNLQLAAKASQYRHPYALEELQVIFTTHNPQRRKSAAPAGDRDDADSPAPSEP
jgi:hypothetical protein